MSTPDFLRSCRLPFWYALAALALSACSGDAPELGPQGFPQDRVFSSESVLVAPGRRWERHAEEPDSSAVGGWVFRGLGDLHVSVSQTPASGLAFRLQPDELTSHYHFEIRWDGKSLFSDPVGIPVEGLELAIPPEDLEPGHHVLNVRRRYRPYQERHPRARHENVFAEVAYTVTDERHVLEPSQLERYRYLSDFLAYGLTGTGKQKRSGFLFAGAQTTQVALHPEREAQVSLVAENYSAAAARFVVRAGDERHETELEAGASSRIRLELPAGRTTLSFSVEGPDEGLYLWGSPWVGQGAGRERTPIVLITTDTTRRDALSPYNGRTELTPNIEAFAGRASVFDNAYSTAPWTLPSHASMFTGLYPSKHGVGVSSVAVDDGQTPVAQLLREAGYLTAGFAGGDLSSYRFGVGRGFHAYRDPERFETQGDVLTQYVEEFLGEFHTEPFFLFVNYFDAHGPYRAPTKFQDQLGLAERAARVANQPVWRALAAGESEGWRAVGRSDAPATPEGLDYLRGAYDSEVAFMDEQMGRLFDALRRYDLFERALIVIVGDHGELLGEGGFFGHSGRLDLELTGVPLIVKWPNQSEGRRIDTLASGVDVFPTMLEAAGLEVPPGDGISLDPGSASGQRRVQVFSEEHESRVHPLNPRLKIASHVYVVQREDFRQKVWKDGTLCQRRDGAAWREVPCGTDGATVLGHLERILSAPPPGEVADAGAVSREVEESLRALGYL